MIELGTPPNPPAPGSDISLNFRDTFGSISTVLHASSQPESQLSVSHFSANQGIAGEFHCVLESNYALTAAIVHRAARRIALPRLPGSGDGPSTRPTGASLHAGPRTCRMSKSPFDRAPRIPAAMGQRHRFRRTQGSRKPRDRYHPSGVASLRFRGDGLPVQRRWQRDRSQRSSLRRLLARERRSCASDSRGSLRRSFEGLRLEYDHCDGYCGPHTRRSGP